jgi:pimeloyl-ACP methyl ester carboxylesterase
MDHQYIKTNSVQLHVVQAGAAEGVVGLIDVAGRETAVVIGHDWGANVAMRALQESSRPDTFSAEDCVGFETATYYAIRARCQ